MLKQMLDRPVTMTMILLVVAVLGIVSIRRLPVSLIPDVDIPYITVQVTASVDSAELDAFLFCCYSGLRYSDFVRLTAQNLITVDGCQWLSFRSQKTGVKISLPLYLLFHGKALTILDRYKSDLKSFFSLPLNSTVNRELKRIKVLAKLNKHFSFHTARHTHATLLIYNGVQITTVQKLLGHRSVKTTEIYSEIFSGTIIKDLKQCKF